MAEENKEIFKYGVKKEKILARIDGYNNLLNEEESLEYTTGINVLRIQLEEILNEIREAEANSASQDVLAKLYETKERYEKEIAEKSESKYVKAKDVIGEVEMLLANAKNEYSFVEIEDIEARIEYYKKLLESFQQVDEAVVSHKKGTAILTLNNELSDEEIKTIIENDGYTFE